MCLFILACLQVYEGGWKNNLQQGQGEHSFASGHYDVAMWDQVDKWEISVSPIVQIK